MTPSTMSSEIPLTLTEEERGYLLAILGQELRNKEVEIHRTDALSYREHLQRQETLLKDLIARLNRAGGG